MTKNIKASLKFNKEMRVHYEDLFNTSVGELRHYRLKVDILKQCLDEIIVLCNGKIKHEVIKKVIDNLKERIILDDMIHNSLLFPNLKDIDNK
jgi:hypothetical protein